MDKTSWNDIIANFPEPQHLQTWEWGELKSRFGWLPHHKVWNDSSGGIQAAALVLERTISLPGMSANLRMHYIPKGPLLMNWEDQALRSKVLSELKDFAKQRRAFVVKIDPDIPIAVGEPDTPNEQTDLIGNTLTEEIREQGWIYSNEQVQYKNTVLLNIFDAEEEILARMKQKTRYNIRLAGRKGVSVRNGTPDDFELLYSMYAETAIRDGFTIRGKEYYLSVWNTFYDSHMLSPLIAEVDGQPVAGLILIYFSGRAWYMYGMSLPIHRKFMPTYLLQWEAIKTAKEKDCTLYDLWGAPENFDESDPLWGVYRFKRGLGGQIFRHMGAWDFPIRPWLYNAYTRLLPKIIGLLRVRGDANTRRDV